MDQLVVPQFIDVEDKIIGPVTTRQFLILLAAGLFIFIAFKLADFALFIFLTVVIGGSSLIIAFVKVNGQSFHYFILNVIQTVKKPSLRVWRKMEEVAKKKRKEDEEEDVVLTIPIEKEGITKSRLAELALVVNTGGAYELKEE